MTTIWYKLVYCFIEHEEVFHFQVIKFLSHCDSFPDSWSHIVIKFLQSSFPPNIPSSYFLQIEQNIAATADLWRDFTCWGKHH